MDDPMVSVIIPVYKSEWFLDECLDSVIGQDYPALEIILVDDGSPDSCPEMCDRYAEAYGYIKTIHQSNQGPGAARNAGLDIATGKYIAFVDSDDRLDGMDAIRRMVEYAKKEQADIVVGLYRRLNGRQFSQIEPHQLQDSADTETVDFRFKGFVSYDNLISPWCKLYRHGFLEDNGLRFQNYPFAEDKSFNMMCCACHPAYAFMDESVYLYRVNKDSIMFQYQDGYVSVWTSIAFDFELFLSRLAAAEEYDDLIAFHVCVGFYFLAKQELAHTGVAGTVKALSKYGKDPLVRKMVKRVARGRYISQIKGGSWKAMIWGTSVLCSLHAYALLAFGEWAFLKIKVRVDEKSAGLKY